MASRAARLNPRTGLRAGLQNLSHSRSSDALHDLPRPALHPKCIAMRRPRYCTTEATGVWGTSVLREASQPRYRGRHAESGAGSRLGRELDGRGSARSNPRATRPAPILCGGCPFCGFSSQRCRKTGGGSNSTTPRTFPSRTCLRVSRARRPSIALPCGIDVGPRRPFFEADCPLAREWRRRTGHSPAPASQPGGTAVVRTEGRVPPLLRDGAWRANSISRRGMSGVPGLWH